MKTVNMRLALFVTGITMVLVSAFGLGVAVERATHHDCATTHTVFGYAHTEDSVPSYVNASYTKGVWTPARCAR